MALTKSRGIVLASRDVGEADRVATFLSEDSGVISLIFKGIRKSKHRSMAATEPGAFIEADYYKKNRVQWFNVREHTLIAGTDTYRNSLEQIYGLFFILEVTRHLAPGMEPSYLYQYLTGAMKILAEAREIRRLAFFYIVQLLKRMGSLSVEDRCQKCGSLLDGSLFMPPGSLEQYCERCARPSWFSLEKEEAAIFRLYSSSGKFNEIHHRGDNETLGKLLAFMTRYLEDHFSVQVKSAYLFLNLY
jgi:DNA repair protein RecO (recombination protein O)